MTERIFNFSAGPAVIPVPGLEQARDEMHFVIETYRKSGNEAEDPRMARDPRVSTYTLFGICLTALALSIWAFRSSTRGSARPSRRPSRSSSRH